MRESGTYALVLYLARAQTIRIGKLGTFRFPRGYYLYVGSALNGLAARLARHLRRIKIKFWHIDYFLPYARVKELWTHQGEERWECLWARAALALPRARIVVPRFGASDCRCPTHLIYFGATHPQRGRANEFAATRTPSLPTQAQPTQVGLGWLSRTCE